MPDNFATVGLERKEVIITTAHNLLLADAVPNHDMNSLLRYLSDLDDLELTIKLLESHAIREAWYANINN